LALILVGTVDGRANSLARCDAYRTRSRLAARDFAGVAQHSADAQREVFASIEAVLKSSAYIYTSAAQVNRSCAIMRASLRGDMPWLRSLTVAGARTASRRCSTWPEVVEQRLQLSATAPTFKQGASDR
jgi:hypothetical protein